MTDYQNLAHKTAQYPNIVILTGKDHHRSYANPYYPALGLAGEAGEYCNKLKKVMRDKGGVIDKAFLEFAEAELGDVLWYVAECATSLGLSLEKIAEANIDKLHSRKERGKIQGDGDNR